MTLVDITTAGDAYIYINPDHIVSIHRVANESTNHLWTEVHLVDGRVFRITPEERRNLLDKLDLIANRG